MKDIFVLRDFRDLHILTKPYITDNYYTKIANSLYEIIWKIDDEKDCGFEDCEIEQFALASAAYFEDVVADLGIWRSFVTTCKDRFGKYLPFYELDEEYYTDEPNKCDIRFLLWKTKQECYNDRFINPENPTFEWLADAIYQKLDEEFESAPVNVSYVEDVYGFDADDPDLMFKIKEMFSRICSTNYLVNLYDYMTNFQEFAESFAEKFNSNDYDTAYNTIAQLSMTFKAGPLKMTALEWYMVMCRTSQESNAKNLLKALQTVEFRFMELFKVSTKDYCDFVFEDVDGQLLDVEFNTSRNKDAIRQTKKLNPKTILTSIIKFNGKWMKWGSSSMLPIGKPFDDLRKEKEIAKKSVELSKKNFSEKFGDRKCFFVENFKGVKKFMNELLGREVPCIQDVSPEDPDEPQMMFFCDWDGDFYIAPAAGISHPDNPYYDKKEGPLRAFELISSFQMDKRIMDYLIDHGMLKTAACNSLKGKRQGRKIVQDNLRFLVRFFG